MATTPFEQTQTSEQARLERNRTIEAQMLEARISQIQAARAGVNIQDAERIAKAQNIPLSEAVSRLEATQKQQEAVKQEFETVVRSGRLFGGIFSTSNTPVAWNEGTPEKITGFSVENEYKQTFAQEKPSWQGGGTLAGVSTEKIVNLKPEPTPLPIITLPPEPPRGYYDVTASQGQIAEYFGKTQAPFFTSLAQLWQEQIGGGTRSLVSEQGTGSFRNITYIEGGLYKTEPVASYSAKSIRSSIAQNTNPFGIVAFGEQRLLNATETYKLTNSTGEFAKELFVTTPILLVKGLLPSKQEWGEQPIESFTRLGLGIFGAYQGTKYIAGKLRQNSLSSIPRQIILSETTTEPILIKGDTNPTAMQISVKGTGRLEQGNWFSNRKATVSFEGTKLVPILYDAKGNLLEGQFNKPLPIEVKLKGNMFDRTGASVSISELGGTAKGLALVKQFEVDKVTGSPFISDRGGSGIFKFEAGGLESGKITVTPLSRFGRGTTQEVPILASTYSTGTRFTFDALKELQTEFAVGKGISKALTKEEATAFAQEFKTASSTGTVPKVKIDLNTKVSTLGELRFGQVSKGELVIENVEPSNAFKKGGVYDEGGGGGSSMPNARPPSFGGVNFPYPQNKNFALVLEEQAQYTGTRPASLTRLVTYQAQPQMLSLVSLTSTLDRTVAMPKLTFNIPAQKQSTLQSQVQLQVQGQSQAQVQKQTQTQSQVQKQIQNIIQGQKQIQRQTQVQAQVQVQAQAQSQAQKQIQQQMQQQLQKQTQVQITQIPTPLLTKLTEPPRLLLNFPKGGIETKKKDFKKLIKEPKASTSFTVRYNPTAQNVFLSNLIGQKATPLSQKEAQKYFKKSAGLNIPTAEQVAQRPKQGFSLKELLRI